jgi:carboxypeptidase Taq
MQDTHWSGGSFGYFPTYTLGNLYAAQIFEKARDDLPDMDAAFEKGDFSGLKTWLNENLHVHGLGIVRRSSARRSRGRRSHRRR